MGQLLDWYSKNNSLIIQSLSLVIGSLLVFFIFRFFFTKENQAQSGDSIHTRNSSTTSNLVEIKQQSQDEQKNPQARSNEFVISNEKPTDSSDVIDKLQAEIFNLKQSIKENESKTTSTVNTAEAVDVSVYQKEIESLKNRLSDYEVIAEDIADLHKLREENKVLLGQIKNQNQPAQIETAEVQNLIEDLTNDLVLNQVKEVTANEKDLLQQFEKQKG